MQVLVLVEGQSEETFIKNCLAPYFFQFQIYVKPIVVSTKRVLSGLKTTGGLTNGNLTRFLSDLNNLINSIPPNGLITTLIDFYALPTNFPGSERLTLDMTSFQKVEVYEQALHERMNLSQSFIPYIQMHEFEALIFSHPIGFQNYIDPKIGNVAGLLKIIEDFDNPELINERKETSPSNRIKAHHPQYRKVLLGNMMLLEIGIERIIDKCPRFKAWIEKIISLKYGT